MDNKIWANQLIFYHKDNQFDTDGTLELSLSNYTSDYKSFSSTNLIIAITNGTSRRSFTLNYQNASDILGSFRNIINGSASKHEKEIFKKYHHDRSLKVEFHEKETMETLVRLFIYYNESDFGRVVVSYDIFLAFASLLKYYVDNYINIGLNISNRFINTEILEQLKGINFGIKSIPGSLSSATGAYIKNFEPDIPDSIIKESEDKINELSTFMDEKLETLTLPEEKNVTLEAKQEIRQEVNSKFISKVLNNDLVVLENLITSASVSSNPVKALYDTIFKTMNLSMLSGISEKDMMSVSYISKLIYQTSLNCYTNYNVSIPSSFPIIKAKVNTDGSEHMDVVFDLLLLSGYVRSVRSKLESKIADASENKAIFHMGLRCFTDAFVYSYLDSMDPQVIKSCILTRFKSYKDIKVFETYESLLESYNCSHVNEKDISTFVDILITKVIGKTPFINDLHDNLYSTRNVKVPSDHKFNLEQILNIVIPAEVFVKTGNKIEDYHNDLDQSIIDLFNVVEEEKSEKKREPKKNNLFRFIKAFENEVPEMYKSDFLSYTEKLNDNFDYNKYNLNEFGDHIVKAIYEWNESNKTEKYTDFYDRCENSLMSKDLILSKSNNVKQESKGDDRLENLNFE